MEQNHDYERACERYLLGELSEQEQSQLEEGYFENDARFERLLAVKHDLIDAYARGDLTGDKRERFERHFLASAARRQHVDEAKEFISAVSANSLNEAIVNVTSNASTESSDALWWRSISKHFAFHPLVLRGAVVAIVLVALAGSWLLVRQVQQQRVEGDRPQHEEASRRPHEEKGGQTVAPPVNENSPELARNNATNLSNNRQPANSTIVPQPGTVNKQSTQPSSAQVASVFLVPFSSRGDSDSNSLLLRPDTRAVRLHLALKGDDYRRYDVVMRTLEGEQVFHRRVRKARSSAAGKSVTLTLDPAVFRRQDYIATLNGLTAEGKLETIGDYYFRVERSPTKTTSRPPQ